MATRRQKRLNELLREELSLLIPSQLDDPRVVGATVTRVEITRDMTTAKVFVTIDGSDEEAALALQALEHAAGFLRAQIRDLGLRRLPELVFARDRQFEGGERVLAILDELRRQRAGSQPDDPSQGEAQDSRSSSSPDREAPTG